MATDIAQLIDFKKVDSLLEGFNKSTGFVTAILDLEGNILSKSGWRQICTEFHRMNPITSQNCTISDTILSNKLKQGEKYQFYKCLNGLVDVAVPLIIHGEHVANLFSGQFFFEEPDKELFIKQAQSYGFDEAKYIEFMSRVPVVSEEKARVVLDFLHMMTQFIAEQSFQRKELFELSEQLRVSETRFRTIFEIASLGIAQVDPSDGKIIFINKHYELITGYQIDELLKMSFVELTHPDDREKDWEIFSKAVRGECEYRNEKRYVKKDGTIVWVRLHLAFIRDETGKAILTVAICEDITERKLIENEIIHLNAGLELKVEQRTAQLEATNKELEAFSYSVSHNLRAPLRHINGYVEMLHKKYHDSLDEKAQHYIEIIKDATKQMGNLIDDLLQFSRTGRKELSNVDIDMNSLIQDVLTELKPLIGDREIIWNLQKLPHVYGDYSLLKLVWTNLLDNALKYTRNQTLTKNSVEVEKIAKNFVFCVRDNGVGFDMNYAHKLFGVFQRLHSQQEFEGTGIGLANVQRIIHKHGGKVWAEGKINEGACFYFSLAINHSN